MTARRTLTHSLLALSLVALATGLAAGQACATGTGPVAVNTSNSTASSANEQFEWTTSRGTVIAACRTSTVPMTISASGDVTVAANAMTFGSCTLSGVTVTITQPNPWRGVWRHLDNAGGNVSAITLTLSSGLAGWVFTTLGCRYEVIGTILADYVLPIPASHNVLFDLPGYNFPASLESSLGLLGTDAIGIGCSSLGIGRGTRGRIRANVTVSPPINMAGI